MGSRPRKNRRRAVAMMHVAIDSHRSANLAVSLHAANGHCHIVDHAESFAVVGKCMVKTSANVDGNAVSQSLACGQNRSSCRQPESRYKIARVRDFKFRLLARAQRTTF